MAEAPGAGTNPLAEKGGPQLFSDLPISARSRKGLEKAGCVCNPQPSTLKSKPLHHQP